MFDNDSTNKNFEEEDPKKCYHLYCSYRLKIYNQNKIWHLKCDSFGGGKWLKNLKLFRPPFKAGKKLRLFKNDNLSSIFYPAPTSKIEMQYLFDYYRDIMNNHTTNVKA